MTGGRQPGEQDEINWRIGVVSLCRFVRTMVGLLQGVAFSRDILAACNSLDLA
jgi:hypothetical protein